MDNKNMPNDNQDNLNQEDSSKKKNQSDLYSQSGNFAIDHIGSDQVDTIKINLKNGEKEASLEKNLVGSGKVDTIKMNVKDGEKEASIEVPYSPKNIC